ncbi:phosphopantetheine-binding protein [Pedobacter nanyangensis]|uniref:phosphopantetheine-binding protein n=1 Tax=Pedobacter nanyangensis TaxID=1562389 RepID=UPI000DE38A76|nr:phosphopantetheine-binding protein [Pedobacter nanyangensis]
MLQKNKILLGCLFMATICSFGCKKDELAAQPLNQNKDLLWTTDLGQKTSYSSTVTTPYQVETEVKRIISEQLGLPLNLITYGASLTNDLGADELDLLEISTEIRDFFNIQFSTGDVENLTSVGSWVEYVTNKINPVTAPNSHSDFIQTPIANGNINVTFACKISEKADGKITEIKDLTSSGTVNIHNIYDSNSNIIKTITTSYSPKPSSFSISQPTNGPVLVSWNGEVKVEENISGVKTTYKYALLHQAWIPAGSPITTNVLTPITGNGGGNPNPAFRDRLVNLFVEVYGCNPAAVLDTVLWQTNALGGDDLSSTELVIKAKNEFGCEIPDEQLELLPTVADLYQYLLAHYTY